MIFSFSTGASVWEWPGIGNNRMAVINEVHINNCLFIFGPVIRFYIGPGKGTIHT